jgi:hypothetical protein
VVTREVSIAISPFPRDHLRARWRAQEATVESARGNGKTDEPSSTRPMGRCGVFTILRLDAPF